MARITWFFRRFGWGLCRCYHLSLKRVLVVALLTAVNMFVWNSWMPDQSLPSPSFLRHLPAPARYDPRAPFPTPLPTPASRYAVGETISACSELLGENLVNGSRLEWLENGSRHNDSVEQLKELLQNCTALKSQHSYWRWPVTAQERHFPLAFGFKMHDAPDMMERLLRALWRPHNVYVIHVDQATPSEVFRTVQDLVNCFDNVLLTDTRIDVAYGSVLSLQADIECVKVALRSPVPWRYYLSVSGHEFPLRTNLEMVQILTLLNGTNDVENYRPSGLFASHLSKTAFVKGKLTYLRSEQRAPFKHADVMQRKGSAYFAATREFLAWVLPSPVCQDYLLWLNKTWAADEMFWATANYLPGAPGGVRVDVTHSQESFLSRAMAWEWDRYKCQGRYVRRVCVFGARDLRWLLSRPELIANKFDNSGTPLVLDCLERALEERAERGYLEVLGATRGGVGVGAGLGVPAPMLSTLNWTYYKALPHLRGQGVGGGG